MSVVNKCNFLYQESKEKQKIYITVLNDKDHYRTCYYNTPLVHWTHKWLAHNQCHQMPL